MHQRLALGVEQADGAQVGLLQGLPGQTLQQLGLGNIVPPALGPFPKLNPEFVVRAKPDLIMGVQREQAALVASLFDAPLTYDYLARPARLVPATEKAGLVYAPDTAVESAADFARQLAAARPRDQLLKSTERGPHRDDFELVLDGRPARVAAAAARKGTDRARPRAAPAWRPGPAGKPRGRRHTGTA